MTPSPTLTQALRRASRRLSTAQDRALRPSGLSSAQAAVLAGLSRHGTAAQGVLAAELGLDRTSMCAALRRLGARGLVAGAACGGDRRVRQVSLTAQGRAVLEEAEAALAALDARLASCLGDGPHYHLRQQLDWIASADFAARLEAAG
jgi:MarR family transcriptional regulator for hemolysin